MKLRVEVDGEAYTLDLQKNGAGRAYSLGGAAQASGSASVSQVMPGVFSVLISDHSFTVNVSSAEGQLEAWSGDDRYRISIADARDRAGNAGPAAASGPLELRAQMPGKIIKLLVGPGDVVQAGQGLIVIEAMKMQNELKAPKEGTVGRIHAVEGATVAAGEPLMIVE